MASADYKSWQKKGNERHFRFPYKRLYTRLLLGAKSKGREVTLTYEEFVQFTKIKNCEYCNALVEWIPHGKKGIRYNLDRKNNNVGYTKENCVVCCADCNFFKADMDEGKFLARVDRIFKNILE